MAKMKLLSLTLLCLVIYANSLPTEKVVNKVKDNPAKKSVPEEILDDALPEDEEFEEFNDEPKSEDEEEDESNDDEDADNEHNDYAHDEGDDGDDDGDHVASDDWVGIDGDEDSLLPEHGELNNQDESHGVDDTVFRNELEANELYKKNNAKMTLTSENREEVTKEIGDQSKKGNMKDKDKDKLKKEAPKAEKKIEKQDGKVTSSRKDEKTGVFSKVEVKNTKDELENAMLPKAAPSSQKSKDEKPSELKKDEKLNEQQSSDKAKVKGKEDHIDKDFDYDDDPNDNDFSDGDLEEDVNEEDADGEYEIGNGLMEDKD